MACSGLRSALMADLPDLGAFGASFEEFMHAMTLAAVHGESEVAVRLREHLGADPKELPTTGAEFPFTEQANLQLASMRSSATRRSLGSRPDIWLWLCRAVRAFVGQGMTGRSRWGRCSTPMSRSATAA